MFNSSKFNCFGRRMQKAKYQPGDVYSHLDRTAKKKKYQKKSTFYQLEHIATVDISQHHSTYSPSSSRLLNKYSVWYEHSIPCPSVQQQTPAHRHIQPRPDVLSSAQPARRHRYYHHGTKATKGYLIQLGTRRVDLPPLLRLKPLIIPSFTFSPTDSSSPSSLSSLSSSSPSSFSLS